MKNKIKLLIQKSRALDAKKKQKYSHLINFMSEEGLKALLLMLKKEQVETQKIEQEEQMEETEFYQKSLAILEETYKQEYKKAIAGEENDDQGRADDLLKQLDSQI